MTFVQTIAVEDAEGDVGAMYDADRDASGQVPNYTRAFSARPAVYAAWKALNGAVKAGMDRRRYELVSVAAARRLRCSYCALAHASALIAGDLLDADALAAVAEGDREGGGALDAVDVAVMELADKVAADAASVTQADVDRLRALGLSDTDVFDVIAAAAARCFFATMLDALGAEADPRFATLQPVRLRDALTIGRPIAAQT